MRFGLIIVACLLAAPAAQAAIVDFESFTAGQPVNLVTFDDGTTATVATVSNRPASKGGTNQAGIFDTNNPTGNDSDLGGPFTSATGGSPLSPGNILIILGPVNPSLGGPDDDSQGGTITFTFSRPVDLLAFSYFDTEAAIGNGLTVTTDNGSSGLLDAGDNEYGRFDVPFLGITTATFIFGGSGGIDGLEIGSPTAIPVPAALPLLFSGLAMFWLLGRTRRRA